MNCTCYSKGGIIKIYASTSPLIFLSYSSSFDAIQCFAVIQIVCKHNQPFLLRQLIKPSVTKQVEFKQFFLNLSCFWTDFKKKKKKHWI